MEPRRGPEKLATNREITWPEEDNAGVRFKCVRLRPLTTRRVYFRRRDRIAGGPLPPRKSASRTCATPMGKRDGTDTQQQQQ